LPIFDIMKQDNIQV